MTTPPAHPKIYHITHVDNLRDIVRDGMLLSDATIVARGGPAVAIGMSTIKRRRIEELEVATQPGTKVGDYVPFYFCPRSVMLFVIHRANHPELTYRGGQNPIIHLEADLHTAVAWAARNKTPWAFSLSNAGACYTEFRSRLEELDELDWNSIAAADFRAPQIKEGKQAEILIHGSFPFELVDRIGVRSVAIRSRASAAVGDATHGPAVEIRPEWYF
jgi:hypothetical protein